MEKTIDISRFTVGDVVCSIVSNDEHDDIVLTHKDYPFSCVISSWALNDYHNKTSGIYIDNKYTSTILSSHGLTYQHGYTIRDRISHERKYGSTKDIVEPSKVNLKTASGSRLSNFYNNWFEFLNKTEYLPLIKEVEEISSRINSVTSYVDTIIPKTKNSTVSKYERETEIQNPLARLKLHDSTHSLSLTVDTYNLTDEQKEKLFIFLDEMSKE